MIIEIDGTIPKGITSDAVDELLNDLEKTLSGYEKDGVLEYYHMEIVSL